MQPPELFNFARDIIGRWERETPGAVALWCVNEDGTAEQKFSFAEMGDASRRAASFFERLGLKRGDRVLVMLPRVPGWWMAMLGLIRLGAVPIPGTPLLTRKDIAYRMEAAGVSAVITDADGAAKVEPGGSIRRIGVGGSIAGWESFEHGLQEGDSRFEGAPTRSADPGIIYFTSGTTGHPKMVLHTQASFGLGHQVTGLWLDLHPGDVHWNLSDTGWAKAAWSNFYGPWLMGATVFVVDARGKFDAGAVLKFLSTFPITTWCAPPTALRLIVREDLARWKFPRLRHCVSAGEPLNPEVISAWEKGTGLIIYEGYGQSESVVLAGNFKSLNRPVRPGSMGLPSPGFELAILGPGLRELPDGTEGELAVRVRPERPLGLFQEYWRNPEENAARFQGDWYLTGDVARRDADGYFWFVSRADDVINSASYRIGPFEVESALLEHRAVLESAVVGKRDPIRSEIVKAYVVLRKGIEPSKDLAVELQEHCKRVTAPYKYPREIEFVPELPKTVSGKIRRLELRQKANGEGIHGG